jgi:methylmalonyl-CoA mutase
MALDFSEFPPLGKDAWLAQVQKDLKGRPLADLEQALPDGLRLSPFVRAEDFPQAPASLRDAPHSWQIAEEISVGEPVQANRSIMDALEGGAEGLRLTLQNPLGAADFEALLQGVHLDFLGLHFAGPALQANPGMWLGLLEQSARQRGMDTRALRGSLVYDPVAAAGPKGLVDWRYLADLSAFASEKFPDFQLVTLEMAASDSPSADLAGLLQQAHHYFQRLGEAGLPPERCAALIQVRVPIGTHYFVEIAKLRALQLLWLHLLKAWQLPLRPPVVEAFFRPAAYTDDLYTNMIRGTTMAMSAVLGGVQRLLVLPYDAGREAAARYGAAFSRRIARNVQHLLKMEAQLDQVADPAAGSYYIENLTQQMARKAWEQAGNLS